ncbi:MAG: MGMT family protein [Moraxellaceae bacterium]|nr:MAG: MGMT family protein [Moraxellaceae bacterium]
MLETQEQRREAIYLALAQIPKGKVITYGNLAKLAGMPNGARLAGRLMCGLPAGSRLPWHRVINAQGKLSLPENSDSYQEQLKRLKKDGVEIKNGKINLAIYAY